jgi:hypothetical protein
MEKNNLIWNLEGPLWGLIGDVIPENYLEPMDPVSPMEIALGEMSDMAKAAYTVQEELFGGLIFIIGISEEDEECINDFDAFVVDASRDEFIAKYKYLGELEILALLEVRNQYLFACQFLDLVAAQQFNLDPDDLRIFYREGFIVAVQKEKLFEDPISN